MPARRARRPSPAALLVLLPRSARLHALHPAPGGVRPLPSGSDATGVSRPPTPAAGGGVGVGPGRAPRLFQAPRRDATPFGPTGPLRPPAPCRPRRPMESSPARDSPSSTRNRRPRVTFSGGFRPSDLDCELLFQWSDPAFLTQVF